MKSYINSLFGIIVIFLLSTVPLLAQDEAFRGGSGDGFYVDTFNLNYSEFCNGGLGDGFSSFVLTENFADYAKGGIGDGFTSFAFENPFFDISSGGIGDGFANSEIENPFFDFTSGGIGDGYSKAEMTATFNDFALGGVSDGFSFDTLQNTLNTVFSGGESDGFAFDKYGHIIYWTGAVGTGWNVPGNWANGLIPTYCNPVVIPEGVPNFPAVNAGTLKIGYYTNEGEYRCQRLKINANAEMTTRVNCYVENYDLIFVRGTLFVKNPAFDAFKIEKGGVVQLKPNAQIVVKE